MDEDVTGGGTGPRSGPVGPADGPTDDELMTELRRLFAADRPPAHVLELARQSFGLRTVDAELAALVADSAAEDVQAVRGETALLGPRLLSFRAAGLSVEVEVDGSRLLGQLVPPGPARIVVRRADGGEPVRVDADEYGRFEVARLPGGPVSLVCERPGGPPVTTEWTALD